MRRLAVALAVLFAVPLPVDAATPPPLAAYVLERVSDDATPPGVGGGAWAADHEYVYAAVASATAGDDGRFDDAEGALFFGATAESDPTIETPAAGTQCSAIPAGGQACANGLAGAGIAFAVMWDSATAFDRVVVVMRGRDQQVRLMDEVRGWRLSRWTGPVREVQGDLAGASSTPYGAGSFVDAEAPGGPGGSVAIGHPPCTQALYVGAGAGAVRLLGGTREVIGNCPAQFAPPAAAAPSSTEWTLTSAAAGVADVPVRMVVMESPPRR